MKNFYYKIASENTEEAVEVYVGQSCGKQISLDLQNANSEILIVSPYIDESKINDLINYQNKNVKVRLAFSDLRDKQRKSILQKLISQKQNIDEECLEKKNKKIFWLKILSNSSLTIFIIYSLFILAFIIKNNIFEPSILIPAVISFVLYNIAKHEKNSAKQVPVFSYTYSKKIDFKFLKAKYSDPMFIHSKIYIIDRKVAYLGSVNFTNNGFTSNFENRVRITHKEQISKLVEFVNSIFDDNYNFIYYNQHELGKEVFSEEKY